MKTKRLALMSVLLSLSLVIFIAESYLPPLAPIPAVKLGLSNIITLMAIYMLSRREAFLILTLRILLGSIFTGNFTALIYSAAGGSACFLTMSVMSCFVSSKRMWAVSVLGAIAHNAGQIAAACFLLGTYQILWYLPVLIISAVITGCFTGIAAQTAFNRLSIIKGGSDNA